MRDLLNEIESVHDNRIVLDPLMIRTGIDRIHLETALALHVHGSFQKTAEVLSMKTSTVRRRIRDLELQLGSKIFERNRRRFIPTSSGKVFLRRTAELLHNFHMLVEAVRRTSDGKAGQIAIGYHGPVAHGALHDLLFETDALLPDLRRIPIELCHDRLIDALAAGKIDLAIVRGHPGPLRERAAPLWSERILVVLPQTHPLLDKPMLHWADLVGETFLVSCADASKAIRQLIIDRLTPHGAAPQILIHEVSSSAIMHMVGAGHGVSLALESVLGDHYAGADYRELSGATGPEYVTSFACWRDDNPNPAFARFLRRLFRRYPSTGIL